MQKPVIVISKVRVFVSILCCLLLVLSACGQRAGEDASATSHATIETEVALDSGKDAISPENTTSSVAETPTPDFEEMIASPEPDWPQWSGRRRDGISEEKGLLSSWPEGGPQLMWKLDHLGYGWSSPIIVGDRLYVTGDVDNDLVLFAFDLKGMPVWQVKNGEAWPGPYAGARACCAFSEGKLYHLNSHGRVACLDAGTGKEIWTCNLCERFEASGITWGFAECLLVDGRQLIVTPGSGKALVAALDKENGQTLWTTPPMDEDQATYSSPALFRHAGRRIIANCSSRHGFGVDADTGKLLWTVPLRNTYGVNITTPVYGNGRVFYVTAYAFGACYELRPTSGGIEAEKAWTTTLDTCAGSVLRLGNRLYGSGYEKHRSWLCIDWDSGQTRSEFKGMKMGSAIYADERLYCLGEDCQASLVQPNADGFEIRGQFRLVAEKTRDAWAHPVLLKGMLYLRYHDALWCYDVRNK